MAVKTLVDQIAVDLFCVVYVGLGNQNQYIELNLVAYKMIDTFQSRRVGRSTSRGLPVSIVHVLRTVEAASDEKTVAGKMLGRHIVN